MKVLPTPLDGVVVVEPTVFQDERGYFLESYSYEKLATLGFCETFVQDNHSLSRRGTVRGLHAQLTRPQGKLVRATEGEIFDVAVDLRLDSPTFRQWHGVCLSAENFLQLYVPPGFAHGFSVLSERAQVQYKCTAPYLQSDEIEVRWNDSTLHDGAGGRGIDWQLGDAAPVLSGRDQRAPLLDEMIHRIKANLDQAPAYRLYPAPAP